MNNFLPYCGLVHATMNAAEKDLPVVIGQCRQKLSITLENKVLYLFVFIVSG